MAQTTSKPKPLRALPSQRQRPQNPCFQLVATAPKINAPSKPPKLNPHRAREFSQLPSHHEARLAPTKSPRQRELWPSCRADRGGSGVDGEEWGGYRDQRVVLPTGDVWFLYGALRGRAVVTLDKGKLLGDWPYGPLRWTLVPASTVRPFLNPAARIVGMAKRGRKEKPSLTKAEAARRNGLMPCREGRRRGRQPKHPAIRSSRSEV